jgi:hypothetical protein
MKKEKKNFFDDYRLWLQGFFSGSFTDDPDVIHNRLSDNYNIGFY